MNYFLMNLAGAIMKGATLFGPTDGSDVDPDKIKPILDAVYKLKGAVDLLIWPLMILVGAAGSIYSVVLGVNMARADSGEKREEAKKRLITAVVGLVIVVALILLMRLLFSEAVIGAIIGTAG